MKVIVAWDREKSGKTASEAKYAIIGGIGGVYDIAIHPSDDGLSQQYLEFEVDSFLSGKGLAEALQKELEREFGIRSFIAVQVVPGTQFHRIADCAVQQELHANRRLKAMQEAIDMLKATRSWFKDKRLAEIRRRLEQNLF